MINWNILVKSRDNAEAARDMLAKELYPDNPNCLDGTDLGFIDVQDYITAVPVEIALTVAERKALRRAQPETRWVITGVKEPDVTNLVVNYGYKVLEPEVAKVPSKVAEDKPYFEVNGKEVTKEEYTKAVESFRKDFDEAIKRFNKYFGF